MRSYTRQFQNRDLWLWHFHSENRNSKKYIEKRAPKRGKTAVCVCVLCTVRTYYIHIGVRYSTDVIEYPFSGTRGSSFLTKPRVCDCDKQLRAIRTALTHIITINTKHSRLFADTGSRNAWRI